RSSRLSGRGSRSGPVAGRTSDPTRGGGPHGGPDRPPAPVRRALRRGSRRGVGGLAAGRLPELEVRAGLAPRRPRKIIRNPRDTFPPDGALRVDPTPEVTMAVDPARAKSLFLAASDLADPEERAAYLDRECAGDGELRARVEALLRANDGAPL